MGPMVAFVVGVFAGAIGAVLVGTMSMKRSHDPADDDEEMPQQGRQRVELRSAEDAQQPSNVSLLPAETAQRLAKSWNLIWVSIWDSEHPLHAAHADPEANSGDYYLRPVLAPEDTDPEQGTIMTFKYSGSRKCYLLDKQNKELAAIPENKRHEMATWHAMQSTGDYANDGPGSNSKWPNLSEMIDGIDVEQRATQATPQIFPKPPQRVVKLEPDDETHRL